jgi:hypothetical protein
MFDICKYTSVCQSNILYFLKRIGTEGAKCLSEVKRVICWAPVLVDDRQTSSLGAGHENSCSYLPHVYTYIDLHWNLSILIS